jgi:hypothetical protein
MKDLFTKNFLPYFIDCTITSVTLYNRHKEKYMELDYVFDDELINQLSAVYDCEIQRQNAENPISKLTRVYLYSNENSPFSIYKLHVEKKERYFMILDFINQHLNIKYNS